MSLPTTPTSCFILQQIFAYLFYIQIATQVYYNGIFNILYCLKTKSVYYLYFNYP